MLTSPNRRVWSFTLVCLLAMVIVGSPSRDALAGDPGPALALRAQPAAEIFDFVLVNIGSIAGDAVTFPAGQQICLELQIDPNPISGVLTPCFGQLPGQRLYGNNPSTPFLRSSTYDLAVASNNTGCAVTIPPVQRADYGVGGWYAIFNVVADCADAPPPATEAPAPTLAPTAVPTDVPATEPPAPTMTPVPSAGGYTFLELRFVPGPSGETPATLPGPVCARIVVDPPLAGAALDTHCRADSFSQRFYYPDFGTTFPLSAAYTADIVSNDSGCRTTPGTFRVVTGDLGPGVLLDVIIDCATATAVPTEEPTPTATFAPTSTPTEAATPTGTPDSTGTPMSTATSVSTSTAVSTGTSVPSATATTTLTPTGTPVPIATSTSTGTTTPSVTPALTGTPTPTETPPPTGTSIPTATAVSTSTALTTATSVPSATSAPSSTPDATGVPLTPSSTSTPGSTAAPSPTEPRLPSPTPAFEPTPSPTSTPGDAIVGLPSTGSGGTGGAPIGILTAGTLLILAMSVLPHMVRYRKDTQLTRDLNDLP